MSAQLPAAAGRQRRSRQRLVISITDVTESLPPAGAGRPSGVARPAHRPAEPAALQGPPRAGARARRAPRTRRRALRRPRPLQARERHARPRRGRRLLREVATRLHGVLAPPTPSRASAATSSSCCRGRGRARAAALAEASRSRSRRPVDGLALTATIGIAVEDRGHSSADLLQDADAALYASRRRGGRCFEVFDRAMEGRLRDRLRIEDGLRRAIAQRRAAPACTSRSGARPVPGRRREALVRWQHPEEGLLGPGRVPADRRGGRKLISAIGDWVLERAVAGGERVPRPRPDHGQRRRAGAAASRLRHAA